MENQKNNEFDRIEYFRGFISAFLQSETKGINAVAGSLNALNKQAVTHNRALDNEKRKILEVLFKNQKFVALIQREKERNRNIRTRRCNKCKSCRKSS